ncbi:GIY-YIG nuclease family protein [Cyanobacteria bacterium FACHB-63]|nr:GIY-YIG nuclease family protein [Cyanobacteria bacterium FACHB-63]
MKLHSPSYRDSILDLAQSILERFKNDRLTRVPLTHLDELPPISGVYLAATEDNQVLYIGKSNNLSVRCDISIHHKLPAALEKGAVFLYIAGVPAAQAKFVEYWLIDRFSPVLNEGYRRWWLERDVEESLKYEIEKPTGNLINVDFVSLELRVKQFLSSGSRFSNQTPEIEEFLAFVKQHKRAYKTCYGLTITETTTAMDAFSRFCRSPLGLRFKSKRIGGRGQQIAYYWLDTENSRAPLLVPVDEQV